MILVNLTIPLRFIEDANIAPMSIYNNESKERLPCTIQSLNITDNNDIVTEPIDSNVNIATHIIKQPRTFSLSVLVQAHEVEDFESEIRAIQYSTNTFSLSAKTGEFYTNLKFTSISVQHVGDMHMLYEYSIEFTEIITVRAEMITLSKKAIAAAKPIESKGEKNVVEEKQKRKSLLKKMISY